MSILLGKNKNRPKAFEIFHLNTYLVPNHVGVVNLVSNLLCGLNFLMSNISYKYTVTYSICNIHALTYLSVGFCRIILP
jgi:uncharacterized membrane protein YkgB